MQFQKLYKKGKLEKVLTYQIEVIEDTIHVYFGEDGGKIQCSSTTCIGKNSGKANETSANSQALLEAEAMFNKKVKMGYSINSSGEVIVKLAMKVKSYQDQINNVKFPCYSSPKLNGVNAIYKRTNGTLTIYSRGGEVYPAIPHLEPLVHAMMDTLNSDELNGELYKHGEHLQDIQSAVKKANPLSKHLSFCIFDIADSTEEFYSRALTMERVSNFYPHYHPAVYAVDNVICISHDEIDAHYNACMTLGYEGTVVKNSSALYQHNVRSSDMFKYKKTLSAEFLIESYNLDKNGLPVFVMKCDAGTFKAKPIGTKEYWASFDPTKYIGKYGTIEYETFSKDGIPLKPVFISLREVDSAGEAKE